MFEIFIIILLFMILLTQIFNFIDKNKKNDNKPLISPNLTKMYMDELTKMIQYMAIYKIDSYVGKTMSDGSLISNIPNDQILDLSNDIEKSVHELILDTNMMKYLNNIYGEKWLFGYIKIYTLSMTLNYSDLSISKITSLK